MERWGEYQWGMKFESTPPEIKLPSPTQHEK